MRERSQPARSRDSQREPNIHTQGTMAKDTERPRERQRERGFAFAKSSATRIHIHDHGGAAQATYRFPGRRKPLPAWTHAWPPLREESWRSWKNPPAKKSAGRRLGAAVGPVYDVALLLVVVSGGCMYIGGVSARVGTTYICTSPMCLDRRQGLFGASSPSPYPQHAISYPKKRQKVTLDNSVSHSIAKQPLRCRKLEYH